MAELLLDTHALLWWLAGDERLSSPGAGGAHRSRRTASSSAPPRPGKSRPSIASGSCRASRPWSAIFGGCIASLGFHELPIAVADGERAGRLPGPHRDPFDRMIVAQALGADLMLVSNEALFDSYGVRRLW